MPRLRHTSSAFTIFLGAVSGLTSLSIDMGLPAVPALERDFGIASGRGTLTLSLFLAGFAIAPLVAGPLSDKVGRRRVLLSTLIVFVMSATACTLAPNFAFLLTARLVQGLAAGAAVVLPLAIVRDLMTGSAARSRMSQIAMVNGLVPIVAPIFGSMVLAVAARLPGHPQGWRVIYGVQTVLSLALLLVVVSSFGESHPPERRQHIPIRRLILNYGEVLTNRAFVQNAGVYALGFGSLFAYVGASPTVLIEQLHVPSAQYGLMFAFTGSGMLLGSFTSSLISKRLGQYRTVALCLACLLVSALGLLVMVHTRWLAPLPVVGLAVLTIFGFGLGGPTISVESLHPIPHVAGAGAGALQSGRMIAGSITSAILGSLTARETGRANANPAAHMALVMSVCVLAAAALYLLKPPPVSRQTRPDAGPEDDALVFID